MTRSVIPLLIFWGLISAWMLWEIWSALIWPYLLMLLTLALVFVDFSLSVGTQ